jgi:murein L,D-transpeptidase YafK
VRPQPVRAALLSALCFSLPLASQTTPQHADQIIVVKSQHRMTLLSHGVPIKVYQVALGSGGLDPKQRQGDNKTPEGKYILDAKNPNSRFHLAFHISYPNAADKSRAKAQGVAPGGDIMIHGVEKKYEYLAAFQSAYDWTEGCIALSNSQIDEFARLVSIGTPIEIKP